MKYLLIAVAVLALAACGSSEKASPEGDTVGAEIAEDFNNALDKARDVGDLAQDSKDNLDDALAEADGAIEEE